MKKSILNIGMMRKWWICASAVFIGPILFPASASGAELRVDKVIYSYGSCTWKNNGDGTSRINVVANYYPMSGRLGGYPDGLFNSRGVMLYTYDRSGKLLPSSGAAKYVTINGVKSTGFFQNSTYAMYHGGRWNVPSPTPEWTNKESFIANIEMLIDNAVIKDWPAIAVRAGNFTAGDDVGEITGGAYVTNAGNGSCLVLDPTLPPPSPAITVNMAAPDWNLGELPRGEGVKTLATPAQQLCFTYTGIDSSRNFVINATNENGVSGNRYRLKNISKPDQVVPYSVTLDGGGATFPLPNNSNSPVGLNKGNRTCFVPTFKTSVDNLVKEGNYSDVLTFTVVTKS
ncbi:hypothetical protein [Burkholderia pyrrocinia]|uniref:hypothetical protein n=1 Tax=Burkholderia pyrrocinia TaxID=60550 RepID=UPI0030D3C6A3